nr:LysR family transcriptional regulator [Pseudomonas aeruginosa]
MPVSDPVPLRHLARPRPVSHARLDGEPPRLQPLAPGNEERHEPKRPAPRRSEPADRVRDSDARTQRDPRRRETVPRPAGQPAISAALSRLRTLFDDPLFVRTGRSMEPTARAQEIFAHLSPALDSISTAMSRASEFDPATSTAVFRIGLSDDVEFGLLPPLLRRLRAEAPGIVLVVRRANYLLMPNLLASGEISVGVSYTDELPANAKRKTVRRSKPKILRADSAPGQLTLDDYCARPHALVSFAGDLSGFVDEELEKFGRKRKVVLAVPQFNGLGTLLAGTDIIATVPDYAAQALIAAGGLRAEDPPFETRAFELSMAWRGAQDNDPAERWLRSRISMFIGDPDSL